MRYGLDVINFGSCADPAMVQRIAVAAESAGWEGIFLWDHLSSAWAGAGPAAGDPWILLAGVACVTERILLGTNVTALPRRRPHVLAGQVTTLDHLSHGRVVLGVGLGGVPEEFERFGESGSPQRRGAMLDEGLEVVTALWSGERVDHRGMHYLVDGVRDQHLPVQRPRPPIWVGGHSDAAIGRAARWDGWTTGLIAGDLGEDARSPEWVSAKVHAVRSARGTDSPFDIIVGGCSEPSRSGYELVCSYEQAGAKWWLEGINGRRGDPEQQLARVLAGPPSS